MKVALCLFRALPRLSTTTRRLNTIVENVMPDLAQPQKLPCGFEKLRFHKAIVSATHSIGLEKPTQIQELAAEPIIARKNTLIAAETGSGKTLAYLLPLLSRLKVTERAVALAQRPSIIVLVPTRQLAWQVLSVAKKLSHVGKFRARGLVGRSSAGKRGVTDVHDLVVTTPGALQVARNAGRVFLSRVETVVLDEADELLALRAGFGCQLEETIEVLRKKGVQFVYAGATITGELERTVKKGHKELKIVKGDGLHRVARAGIVNASFVRVDGGAERKMAKMVEILSQVQKRGNGKVMVFCNGVDRRREVVEVLNRRGIGAIHASIEGEEGEGWGMFAKGEARVAVCSKSFGRGVDDAEIDTVVMMDVPMTGGEYVHRVGRIRGQGRAYVLVGHRERAVAEALFLAHVNGGRMAGVGPKIAWKWMTKSGKDRIAFDGAVRAARKKREARWVDERPSQRGTFRGNKLTKPLRRGSHPASVVRHTRRKVRSPVLSW